jgi:hypothetical protein
VRDTADPVEDEHLAKFVVASHMRSHPRGQFVCQEYGSSLAHDECCGSHMLRIRESGALFSVVDPYSFFPDPDPEFDVGDQSGSGFRIRIQYGSRALMTKN